MFPPLWHEKGPGGGDAHHTSDPNSEVYVRILRFNFILHILRILQFYVRISFCNLIKLFYFPFIFIKLLI